MENEVILESAMLDLTDQLVGKPVTAQIGGKKRVIGVVAEAKYVVGKGILFEAEITDETLAGQLNYKALAAVSDKGFTGEEPS